MKKKIFTKLDRRHTGYSSWKYYISRPAAISGKSLTLRDSLNRFHQWREWCWTQWGPSKELENWLNDDHQTIIGNLYVRHCQNEHWCWQNDRFATRIYFRDDKELSAFLFKWAI